MLPSIKFSAIFALISILVCASIQNVSSNTITWNQGPINCYVCASETECAVNVGLLRKCNDVAQSCVAVFNAAGAVTQRGCSDTLEEVCAGEDQSCYTCKSHGCNTLTTNKELIECLACDAKTDANCVFNVNAITATRKCHKSCVTALYARTTDVGAPLELARTCLDDIPLDEREACAAGEDANCVACSTEKCNKAELGERSSCYQCSGDSCEDPKVQTCRAVSAQKHCFVRFDDDPNTIIEMGCTSQYDAQDLVNLLSSKRLWICENENCNRIEDLPQPKECALCNSRTEPNCAIAPELVKSRTTCNNIVNTDCYQRILEDGHTERGCATSLDGNDYYNCTMNANAAECMTCQGEACNTKLYPEDRLACHVCNSKDDANCETKPSETQTCWIYTAEEQCVSAIDINGDTHRGCSSDLACDSSVPGTCQYCAGKNCNTVNLKRQLDGKPGLWQDLPLSCHSCNSVEDCASASSSKQCSEQEYCITVFGESGAITARGCSAEVEQVYGAYCDENSDKCFNCNSNECNSAVSLTDYVECIYCDSAINPDCISNPTAVVTRRQCNGQCMTALYPRKNSNIYDLTRSCLDDKDTADRNECSNGNDKECIACSGAACNTVKLPETRLSCYKCSEDCEEAEPTECANYTPNDKCYTRFDNESSVVAMGCYSDLTEEFIEENIHELYICDTGDDCNSFQNVPQPNSCVACNSASSEDCAVNPSAVGQINECNVLPNTGCVTLILNGGFTERGCMSDLNTQTLKNCLLGKGKCLTCSGKLCNQEIYPEDRRSCLRCNSIDDPLCESGRVESSICPRYSEDQGCSVKLVNGDTYRGCTTEFICDDTDKQRCRVCSGGDNCNVVDLASTQIGYPGKWQSTPINCYTCYGEQCKDNNLGTMRKCENNNEQNCATVFASNGTVVQRGCSDLVYSNEYSQYCDENPAACKFCKSNGCNNAKELSDYVDCIHCDGSQNGDCVTQSGSIARTVSCQKSCFTGLYPRTTATDSAFELSRGCLDDLDLDDREACASGDKAYCVSCEGALCNTVAVPEKRLSCNYCVDGDCQTQTSKVCTAYRENDQCYIHVDELSVESMGCASDLEIPFIEANKRNLLLCDGDNCNDKGLLNEKGISCTVCQSNSTAECIGSPQNLASTVCEHYLYPQCITHITDDGVVVRGCLIDTDDNLFEDCLSGESSTCKICNSNDCNVELYPPNWRSCLRCDSQKEENCETSPASSASYCPIYEAEEACVTKLERSRTIRGCKSEITCDPDGDKNCRICNDNNCNDVNLMVGYVGEPGKWQNLPLNCQTCNSLEECSAGSTLKKCLDNNKQVCMTVFDVNKEVVQRGCSDVVTATHSEYCDKNSDNCPKCKSNACNTATSLDNYIDCYFCDADEDPNCGFTTPSTASRKRKCENNCITAMYPRSSAADSPLIPTRSCLDDLDLDDREDCIAGKKDNCKACDTALCNNEPILTDPHECYVCADSECEDITSTKCTAYRPNDQCYIAFEDSSIVAMGCVSEFETQVVIELVQQQQLLLCDGKNCNNPSILPTPNTCSACNSANDVRCATSPNTLFTTELCTQLPYTQCVTRIDANGNTQRGCLSELTGANFYDCLMGKDGLCEPCVGDRCNGFSVFPENRLKCHQCESKSDPNCAAAPNSNNFCTLYVENDACVTVQRGDNIIRGCNSTVTCEDESDTRVCRICNSDGCNTIDLEKANVDGTPGTWQPVPISCLTCDSEEECSTDASSQTCEKNIYQNCISVFNAEGKIVQRGCSDSVLAKQESYCDANAKNCPRCNSNDCNVATSREDYIECLACDTRTNTGCVSKVVEISTKRNCYKQCMTALYPILEEEKITYATIRSCYDDMDKEDRDSCVAGNKEHCVVCNDDNCNVGDVIENRLSCNVCEDDACSKTISQKCPNYREGDQCYIEFDSEQTVKELGCISQYSLADTYILQKSKRLWLCDGDNCNTLESIPEPKTCTLCNSRSELSCATNPSSVTSETECVYVGIPECYSRILEDGNTERGCLSNLYDDEFLGCYNGTSTNCLACTGDACNKNIYPTGRRSCHICDSQNDASCESNPNSQSICPLYAEDDVCVTTYRNDVTYRGCGSSISCDESDPRNCVKCSTDACNVVDLASAFDDNFGKWQDLPLTCLTCSGDDCNSAEKTVSETCRNNNEQDCVTVFDTEGKVVKRGCNDAVASDCTAGSCFKCKSNDCNSATAKSQFIECVYCDSFKDSDCLWNAATGNHKKRQCQGGCMTALYPAYDGENPALDLIRTCLNDKEIEDQTICTNGNDPNCAACSTANCNVEILPAERLTCYTCDGDDCESPEVKPCALYKKDDRCFTQFDTSNSVDQMGCLSAFRNQDLESVIKTKRVIVCEGDACNSPNELPSPTRCAVCNSAEDENCATNPTSIGTYQTCSELPYSHCVTRLQNDGTTTRGCVYDLPQNDFAACVLGTNANCTVCANDGCNNQLFPADRLQCYKCSSEDDPECESFPSYALACPIVSDSMKCITSLSNNVTTRGCSSEVECQSTDYKNCRQCQGIECNGIDLRNRFDDGVHGWWQPLPLRCHTCVGEHCKQSLGPAYACEINSQQDCKTVFESDGTTIKRRGCADDVDDYEDAYCRRHPELCFTCKSNECNAAWSATDFVKCAYCNSESDPLCASNPENAGFASRNCQDGCLVALKDSQLIRSCLSDKEELDRDICNDDQGGNSCAKCQGAECNKFVYPADRRKCHVCTGSTCTASTAEYCVQYKQDDFCFAKYENGNVEAMGCGSVLSTTQIEQWTNENKLYRCDNNECNELNRLPVSGVCIACDSSQTLDCARDPENVTTTETCHAPENGCVTRVNAAGHTIRGCLNALSTSDQKTCVAAGTCAACAGEKCNYEIFPNNRRKCHVCSSAYDDKCAMEPDSVKICSFYAADDTCVSTHIDGVVLRGCGSEMGCDGTDPEHCQICNSDACNTNPYNDSAIIFGSSLFFTLIAAFVTIFIANH